MIVRISSAHAALVSVYKLSTSIGEVSKILMIKFHLIILLLPKLQILLPLKYNLS